MKKLYLILLPLLLFLPACGTMGNLSKGIVEARELMSDAKETFDAVKPEIDKISGLIKELSEMGDGLKGDLGDMVGEFKDLHEKAKAAADKDGDGALSWTELIAYILAGGGGGVVILRRYLEKLKKSIVAEALAAAPAPEAPPQ